MWKDHWEVLKHNSQPAFTCSKLIIETLEHWRRSGIFIINFEHISHLALSSNINKVIKTVLTFFFLGKDFTRTKKHKKHRKEPRHKRHKRNKKHQKALKA